MGLTYDGITYRSLEEQVRYDAEQVQLLKQADVTINENLQTVNTELDGKLTKPTNPSAESAVTMLANGTVGTKPLSEIGGAGGGKLYKHKITITTTNSLGILYFEMYNTSQTEISKSNLIEEYANTYIAATLSNNNGIGCVAVKFSNSGGLGEMTVIGVVYGADVTGINSEVSVQNITDTVNEV